MSYGYHEDVLLRGGPLDGQTRTVNDPSDYAVVAEGTAEVIYILQRCLGRKQNDTRLPVVHYRRSDHFDTNKSQLRIYYFDGIN